MQRTKDDSFVERLHERGVVSRNDGKAQRYRNLVTHCIGGSHATFKTSHGRQRRLRERDLLLLCSDGLWGQVPEPELCARLRHHGSLERMVSELAMFAAQSAAPSSDNITLLALRWLCSERADKPIATPAAVDLGEQSEPEELRDAIDQLRSAIEDFESDA
jgi:protein phosphatase